MFYLTKANLKWNLTLVFPDSQAYGLVLNFSCFYIILLCKLDVIIKYKFNKGQLTFYIYLKFR